MERKLTNVACAGLAELHQDYEDCLRHRHRTLWPKEDPRRQELIDRRCETAEAVAAWVRQVCARRRRSGPGGCGEPSTESTASTESFRYSEIAANAALILLAVATSLLDRQVASLAQTFEREGGFRERLYRVHSGRRGRQWVICPQRVM